MHKHSPRGVARAATTATGPDRALTVAAGLQLIDQWPGLAAKRRRDLVSALNAVVRMAAMPASNVVLTVDFLRQHVLDVSGPRFGVSRSRMFNIRALLRSILERADVIDARYSVIAPEWLALLDRLDDKQRLGLVRFARFCTSRQLAPSKVSDDALEDFLVSLVTRTLTTAPRELAGRARTVWNAACASVKRWPGRPLAPLRKPDSSIKPSAAFSESFRQDLAAFGFQLRSTMLDAADDDLDDDDVSLQLLRRRPVRAITAKGYLDHARWAASALVASGQPIAAVSALRDLVTPFGTQSHLELALP